MRMESNTKLVRRTCMRGRTLKNNDNLEGFSILAANAQEDPKVAFTNLPLFARLCNSEYSEA